MNFKKVVFFPDPKSAHTEELKKFLGDEFSCFDSRELDEYGQVFLQTGKFTLIFSDAKSTLEFLKKKQRELSELQFKIFLFLPVNANFNAEAQKKLKAERIHVFPLLAKDKLVQDIRDYFNGNDDEQINIEDIQFIMPKDD